MLTWHTGTWGASRKRAKLCRDQRHRFRPTENLTQSQSLLRRLSSVEAVGRLESRSQDGGQNPQERAGIPETTAIPASWRRQEGVARQAGACKTQGPVWRPEGKGPSSPGGRVALRPRAEGKQTAAQPECLLQGPEAPRPGAQGLPSELLRGSLAPDDRASRWS